MSSLYIGLLSGTSMDAIDAALVRCTGDSVELICPFAYPVPPNLRQRLQAMVEAPSGGSVDELCALDLELGDVLADAALTLLAHSGHRTGQIRAIGSHGQTIRHRPRGLPTSLQLGDPNRIAHRTGIETVADFRRADLAAGGQGAPLASALHKALWAIPGSVRAIVNIGGIANITTLWGTDRVIGFDTGPGNGLMDAWAAKVLDTPFDADGSAAESGNVDHRLMQAMLGHPFFARPPPKSTGRDEFTLHWLEEVLDRHGPALSPADVMATLNLLTAQSIADALSQWAPEAKDVAICGGGARNPVLMENLKRSMPECHVCTTGALGLEPEWVEAVAFAWLAARRLAGIPGNLPEVTGASTAVVLGATYAPTPRERPTSHGER